MGTARRSILMLCYYYPPLSSAGTQRNVAFARLLSRVGWKPIVLTVSAPRNRFERTGEPAPEDVEAVRTYEWDLHNVLVIATGVLNRICDLLRMPRRPSVFFSWCLPDPQIAWFTTIRGALLARRCSAVYASCSPFSAAVSACLIKKLTSKPVVIDFRDAWTLNPHGNYSGGQRKFLGILERWVVRTCDALILNTPGAERVYRHYYPEYAAKMTCIPNGFDRLNVPAKMELSGKFIIMHVGDFYRSRSPRRLLEALANIGNRDIEFVQVGPQFSDYDAFKDRVSIRLIDRVAHAEAMRLMQTASVLYLCQGRETGIADYIAVASKTYEYLATGLPVLAECPEGDNAEIVREYASQSWVITSEDVADLEGAVMTAYNTRANMKPHVSPTFIAAFSREGLSTKLASVLEQVVPRSDGVRSRSPSEAIRR